MALLHVLTLATAAVAGPATDLAHHVRDLAFDPDACYRVRNLRIARDEIRLYLNDGYLIFAKPIAGARVSAVFSGDVEGGDAELLVLPPHARERKSLAAFAGAPNLNVHFKHSVMVFTDETAAELDRMLAESAATKSAEMGALLSAKFNPVLKSFSGSFEVRLVEDLLSPNRRDVGFFFAAFGDNPLGAFDLIHDPRLLHQVSVGQIAFRNERRFFDVWTNFAGRSFRMGQRQAYTDELKIERVAIQASIEPDLMVKARTRLRVIPKRTERAITLELSQQMRVTEVKVDGAPGDSFSPESLRANLMRGADNQLLLITGPAEFAAGRPVELEIAHEGRVIAQAGEKVYFVSARSAWYPNRSSQFAEYEAVFRFPKHLDLVATGELVDEQTEGELKISRRKTSSPVRLYGFNLGEYERATASKAGLRVEVYANRKLETALLPKPRTVELPAPGFPRGPRRPQQDMVLMPPPAPNPAARIQELAAEIATTFEEMSTRYGPPPLKTLTVSPIPGRFGQGFPGLVYLSTLAYLDPTERPLPRGSQMQQIFFSEILHSHEVAHQWWGNGVTSADYQDDWLMESLANYSALWALERRKGAKTLDAVLEQYRDDLLQKDEAGRTVESTGPLTLGHRLHSSQSPTAWPTITYEKGSWVMHMLRRRLGDERFAKMLAQLYSANRGKAISTEHFQRVAAEFLPAGSADPKLEAFFEQWVHGTGIPALKLEWSVSGRAPKVKLTGTVTQTDVDENFSALVPVEVQIARQKPIVRWVASGAEPSRFEATLPAAPARVTLDPSHAVLRR